MPSPVDCVVPRTALCRSSLVMPSVTSQAASGCFSGRFRKDPFLVRSKVGSASRRNCSLSTGDSFFHSFFSTSTSVTSTLRIGAVGPGPRCWYAIRSSFLSRMPVLFLAFFAGACRSACWCTASTIRPGSIDVGVVSSLRGGRRGGVATDVHPACSSSSESQLLSMPPSTCLAVTSFLLPAEADIPAALRGGIGERRDTAWVACSTGRHREREIGAQGVARSAQGYRRRCYKHLLRTAAFGLEVALNVTVTTVIAGQVNL